MAGTNVKITVENDVLKATLEDNPTSNDLISKFPLTLTLKDLYRREKYINNFEVEVQKSNTKDFSRGDISYYLPNDALVFYYQGEREPLDGLVHLGKVTEGIERLENYSGNVEVTLELE